MNVYQVTSGSAVQLATTQVTVTTSTAFRTVVYGTTLLVYVNGALVLTQPVASTGGHPGVGGTVGSVSSGGTPLTSDSFASVQIGPRWTTPPLDVPSTGFAFTAYPSQIWLKWQPASDGSGPGISEYVLTRGGNVVAYTGTALLEFYDAAVTPNTTYTYTIQAVDWHGNSSPGTSFSITTPATATGAGAPPNSFDPRRTGIQPTGSYWGGGGEQIDTRSGNLNFSFPLVKAQGRNGWSVPVGLVYNSQNWRLDNGVNWQLGYDVGYGFGWKMLVGSVVPVYAYVNGPVDHYIFTDSTGAEYRLDQNNNGIWGGTQGLYAWFDAAAHVLHFKDGSFWNMGSVSGESADLGTMYPTIVEDVNGNQVVVAYDAGNASARITSITDVRSGAYGPTYLFTYDASTPHHLISFRNGIQTGESGNFNYNSGALLSPPFGTDPAWFGHTTTQLASFNIPAAGTYQFTYDGLGAQELTRVSFPWGGYLAWDYVGFGYSGGRSLREVSARYLAADSAGANRWTYAITRPDASGSVEVHSGMTLVDASGNGAKKWTFLTTTTAPAAWKVGLVSEFRQLATAGSANAITHDSYSWTQNGSGTPYLSAKTSVMDEGTANAQSALSTQTQDAYGNTTQSAIYPFNNTTTPKKLYTMDYLGGSYIGNYIRNRLHSATLTADATSKVLVTNTYDTMAYCCSTGAFLTGPNTQSLTGTMYQVDASPPLAWNQRGLVTKSETPAKTTGINYWFPGGAVANTSSTDGMTSSSSADASTNFAAPQSLQTQSYSETIGYNSWLGITSTTGANGETLTLSYDPYSGRPTSAQSPFGATTYLTYSYPGTIPAQQMRTGPDGFTRTTLDGLGRAIRVERGPDATHIQSIVDTVYAPCACSPLGKVQKVSQPYAPGTSWLRPVRRFGEMPVFLGGFEWAVSKEEKETA